MRAIKHPNGVGTLMTNSGFTQGRWNRLQGLDGRNVTHRINTLTDETHYSPSNSTHMMLCVEEPAPSAGSFRDMGTGTADRFQFIINFHGSSFYRSYQSNTAIEAVSVPADIRGVWVATRNPSGGTLYLNGSLRATQARADTVLPPTTTPITIFLANYTQANKMFSGASLGVGLDNTEAINLSTIMQTARTARTNLVP
jgi:hypothetical protein